MLEIRRTIPSLLSECDHPPTMVSLKNLAPVWRLFFGVFDVIRQGTWFASFWHEWTEGGKRTAVRCGLCVLIGSSLAPHSQLIPHSAHSFGVSLWAVHSGASIAHLGIKGCKPSLP